MGTSQSAPRGGASLSPQCDDIIVTLQREATLNFNSPRGADGRTRKFGTMLISRAWRLSAQQKSRNIRCNSPARRIDFDFDKVFQQQLSEDQASNTKNPERKLKMSLAQMEDLMLQLKASPNNDALIGKYKQARREALTQRHNIVIARDAMGLTAGNAEQVSEMFPIPGPYRVG